MEERGNGRRNIQQEKEGARKNDKGERAEGQRKGKGKRKKVGDGDEQIENQISRDEVNEAISRLKETRQQEKMAWKIEALKYGALRMRKEMWRICKKVWKGEGLPEEWKTWLVVPLIRKGEGKKVEEYRGITLMFVGYQIYAEVLRRSLERQVEEKANVPHNRTCFIKGMGTVANVYVLNYLVNRNLGRKKGKLVALFVDLKAAFESVNRRIL
ncbi:uncharacterized protein LOC117172803 [Belonocnema kinseyi]|uniref:uncharacterized protein LOC117172803 n=1 Tax=Belonocnema kinseyi TaxID=2817044 RepID=UPI00143D2164|nr:uncharacterized protein LOC117172803 [Belonocnema kinseyi]